ncbi:MAG: hypothetical protein ACI4TS_03515 [Bacteroidaceae bacterium]
MKKRILSVLSVAIIGVVAVVSTLLFFNSCSSNKKVEILLTQIPDNMYIVAAGNVKTILSSGECSIEDCKIILPSFIKSELDMEAQEEFEDVNRFFKKAGIDPSAVAIASNYKQPSPYVIFGLKDKKQFIDAIEDKGYSEKDENDTYTVFSKKTYESEYDSEYDNYSYIAVKDECAILLEDIWVGSKFKPLDELEKFIGDASESNYADTPFGEYILSGNAFGAVFKLPGDVKNELRENGMPSDIISMWDGAICVRGDLEDNKCLFDVSWLDDEGNEKTNELMKKFCDPTTQINKDLLAYLNKNENFVFATSLKDFNWDKYINYICNTSHVSRMEMQQINALTSYLKRLNGTMALGFGLTNGLESIAKMGYETDVPKQFSSTLIVETKESKAKSIVNELKGLIQQNPEVGISMEEESDGFCLNINDVAIYVKQIDNTIIVANHKIKKDNNNPVVNIVNIENKNTLLAFAITSGNKLMKDLKLDNDITCVLTNKNEKLGATLTVEVKGGNEDGIIAKIAQLYLKIYNQGNELEQKMREYSGYNYNNSYDDEYLDMDTAVVDEYYEYADSTVSYY